MATHIHNKKATHNLHIALVDLDYKPIQHPFYLQKVYDEIADKELIRTCTWQNDGNKIAISVHWRRQELTPIEKMFMGDLYMIDDHGYFGKDFTNSEYLLYEFMRMIFIDIEQTHFNNIYRIEFYISKLLKLPDFRPLCIIDTDDSNPLHLSTETCVVVPDSKT